MSRYTPRRGHREADKGEKLKKEKRKRKHGKRRAGKLFSAGG
jgi:hypothetical protein